MLQRLIGENIQLEWHPCDDNLTVRMDPSQIDQILANLCVNARDAISDVGLIVIETEKRHFDADYCRVHVLENVIPGEYALLRVCDNGCGMDKDTLSHVFEPFFTTKDVGKGTGLGLATVYGIVRQNNGVINAYSEPGHGTTFTVALPLSLDASPGNEDDPPVAESAIGGGETILLVEDEPALLTIASDMLNSQGYKVLSANSPEEAIRLAAECDGAVDLLLSDVVMPGMNGRELSRRLTDAYPRLKCLFMSGYTADVIASHGILDESVSFIQKPFTMDDLAGKIRELLRS